MTLSPSADRETELERLGAMSIDWRFKGFPTEGSVTNAADIAAKGWNVLGGDFLLPMAVLKETALAHNIDLMARYCSEHGVSLAPHAKTSLAPRLVLRQLDAGAWGATVANVSQARVLQAFGVRRILIANEVVEPSALRWIADELRDASGCELIAFADSIEGVERMAAVVGSSAGRPLRVVVELGVPGMRTGCRTTEEGHAVADAIAYHPQLDLAGVGGFEGVIDAGSLDSTLAAVDQYLSNLAALARELDRQGCFGGRDEIVLTAGGSVFFDRVVAALGPGLSLSQPHRVVLRSGCYLAHDTGAYELMSPLAGRGDGDSPLQPALEVWGVVLSRPEPTRVIVGVGKRDVSHDVEFPRPVTVCAKAARRAVGDSMQVVALNDQHAYLALSADDPLAVGDLIGFGISHPCTTFDKWRLIPVVDDEYTVVDTVATYF